MSQSSATSAAGPARRAYLDLFLVSVFLLFLELLLIRWLSTEVRILAYLSNVTLIACFLGMGLGCLLAGRERPGFVLTFPLLAAFVAVVALPRALSHDVYRTVSVYLGDFNDMPLWNWGVTEGKPLLPRLGALALLVVLFVGTAAVLVPGGRLMGRLFAACPGRLAAYSVNILGSLVGVWLFAGLSWTGLSPAVWTGLALTLGAPLLRGRREAAIWGASALAVLVTLAAALLQPRGIVLWSPYQKLEVRPLSLPRPDGTEVPLGYQVDVNDTFYQRIINLDPAFLAAHADAWPNLGDTAYVGYNLLFHIVPSPRNVLVVGAGSGNDVAAALRNGAAHVDAVEIDPVIANLGRRGHPEAPYSDPRVTLHVDDARSFFRKTTRRYDLILFGALDSHTLASSLSTIRIDNYVYTVEAFAEARDRLTPDGVLAVMFAVERPFIGVRLQAMLAEVFGEAPVVFSGREMWPLGGAGGGPTFLASRAGAAHLTARLQADPNVARVVDERAMSYSGEVPCARDDWPYLYLSGPRIPHLYVIALGTLFVLAALAARPFVGDLRSLDWPFFLLGAGFLLVEVQSISKMALLFGSTWIVNAIVISAVMLTILAANGLAARLAPRSLTPLYAGLFAALLLNLFFPFACLLALGPVPRAAVAGGIMALPVLFSGVIFVTVLARARRVEAALGANILGAIAGGASESLSFVVGINALGWVAAAFYALSLLALARRGGLRPGTPAPGE